MVYTQSIDWTEFYAELDRVLAEMEGEHFEAIVAIAQGGIMPAALLQQEWGIRMARAPEERASRQETSGLVSQPAHRSRGSLTGVPLLPALLSAASMISKVLMASSRSTIVLLPAWMHSTK